MQRVNIVTNEDVLNYLKDHPNQVAFENDNDGQIVIYTGLWETTEGVVYDSNPNEEE